ncbi:hypothetical protein BC829DRAFT_407349 [Chytridium lagenaria]|nr:hypothetical protein BC829DRAFT_407349 [Chytridium lagenaria]
MLSLDSVPLNYLNPTSIPSLRLITRTFTHSWNFCTSFHFCFSKSAVFITMSKGWTWKTLIPGNRGTHEFYGLGNTADECCSNTRCFFVEAWKWRAAFQMLIEYGVLIVARWNAREAVDILTSLNLLHMVPSAVETIKRNLAMHPALAKVVDLQLSNAIKRKHSEACRCLCEARFSIESNLESLKLPSAGYSTLEKARLGGLECEPATHIIKFTNSIDVLQSILLNPRMQIDIKTFRNAALRCNAVDILIKLAETFPMDASEIHIRAIAVLTREKLYDPRKHRQNHRSFYHNQFALRWAFEECDLGLSEVLMADERVDLMVVADREFLRGLLWIRYELFGDEMTLLDFQNLLVCAGFWGDHHHYLRQLMDITRSENEVLANVLTFAELMHERRQSHLSVAPMTSACVNAAICKARDVGDDEIVNFLILKSSTMADLALQEQGAAVRAGSSCVSQ